MSLQTLFYPATWQPYGCHSLAGTSLSPRRVTRGKNVFFFKEKSIFRKRSRFIRKKGVVVGSAGGVETKENVVDSESLPPLPLLPPLWQSSADDLGPLDKPRWTGDDVISTVLNGVISYKPIFGLMKKGARQVMISTAEKAGVPWRERVSQFRSSSVFEERERVEKKDIVYPSYYLKEFHAYEKGNLCWEAAFEVESATASMCLRTFPSVPSVSAATHLVRGGWLAAVERHRTEIGTEIGTEIRTEIGALTESRANGTGFRAPGTENGAHGKENGAHGRGKGEQGRRETVFRDILDVGCGSGLSTRLLAEAYPEAQVVGLDLSPYFLAVASYQQKEREREREAQKNKNSTDFRPIRWIHGMGEDTGLPEESFDLVSFAYLMHECPSSVTRAMLCESFRLLRPGGILAITDNAPKSKVIQSLPAPVFTLMKATEPFADEYFALDLEEASHEAGFSSVVSVLSDPRHRTLTATK